jgi:hypothetical protein
MNIPSTVERVPINTTQHHNEKIARQIERNIAYYAGHPSEIDRRLEELDREWDIERTLEAQAATLSLVSIGLSLLGNRKLLFLPLVVGGFLLQHAVQGWCPPLPILRRLGVRTPAEIDQERYALKALRGDFNQIDTENKSRAEIIHMSHHILEAVK